jgi:hypothetical protein
MRGPGAKVAMSSGPRPDAVDAGETTASEGTAAGSGSLDMSAPIGDWSPSEEDIRVRAYHRYLERGGGNGLEFEDWLEAERELRSQQLKVKS